MAPPEEIKVYRPTRRSPSRHFTQVALEPLAMDAVSLYERTEAGLDVTYLQAVIDEFDLSTAALARLLKVSPSTLTRRIRAGKTGGAVLSPSESDRLFTILRVYAKAVALFEGDHARARHWMRHPVRGLGDRVPLDMLATETGAHAVEQVIGRLEHGVFT